MIWCVEFINLKKEKYSYLLDYEMKDCSVYLNGLRLIGHHEINIPGPVDFFIKSKAICLDPDLGIQDGDLLTIKGFRD
jgi:hypothetical protein